MGAALGELSRGGLPVALWPWYGTSPFTSRRVRVTSKFYCASVHSLASTPCRGSPAAGAKGERLPTIDLELLTRRIGAYQVNGRARSPDCVVDSFNPEGGPALKTFLKEPEAPSAMRRNVLSLRLPQAQDERRQKTRRKIRHKPGTADFPSS